MTGERDMPAASGPRPGPRTKPPTCGYSSTKDQHLSRLALIEGELRHGHQMIDNDGACMDVVAQITGIQAALDELALGLLADHAHRCVIDAKTAEQVDKTDELMSAIRRLVGRDQAQVPDGSPNNPEPMRGQIT